MALEDAVRTLVDEQMKKALLPLRATMAHLAAAAAAFAGGTPAIGRPVRKEGAPRRGRPMDRVAVAVEGRQCAVMGCENPSRSKGYCSAHYQKRRNMAKAGRLPKEWIDSPAPGTIPDVKVPRGRAAAKARKGKA